NSRSVTCPPVTSSPAVLSLLLELPFIPTMGTKSQMSRNEVSISPPDPAASIRLASFDQHRSLLFSVAYRMLGVVSDAEDMLQETFIRWQQASDQEIRSPRAYLITIVSRLCINHLQSARAQREEYVGQWLPEPIPTDPGLDPLGLVRMDESLSIA